jgi:hypothetical protein
MRIGSEALCRESDRWLRKVLATGQMGRIMTFVRVVLLPMVQRSVVGDGKVVL